MSEKVFLMCKGLVCFSSYFLLPESFFTFSMTSRWVDEKILEIYTYYVFKSVALLARARLLIPLSPILLHNSVNNFWRHCLCRITFAYPLASGSVFSLNIIILATSSIRVCRYMCRHYRPQRTFALRSYIPPFALIFHIITTHIRASRTYTTHFHTHTPKTYYSNTMES